MSIESDQHRIIPRRTAIRWAILMVSVLILALAILLDLMVGDFFGLRQLAQSSPTLAAAKMLTIAQVLFGIMTATTTGVGAYVLWYATRSLQCGVFPPLGAWLIEGGVVHTGNKARAIALLQIGLGIALIGTGCVAAYYAWGILPEVFRTGRVALAV